MELIFQNPACQFKGSRDPPIRRHRFLIPQDELIYVSVHDLYDFCHRLIPPFLIALQVSQPDKIVWLSTR